MAQNVVISIFIEEVISMIYPSSVQKGDFIGITAPSAGVTGIFEKKLNNAILQLKTMGYECIESPSVRKSFKATSTSAIERAREFLDLYRDDRVKIIMPPWGGNFLMEILPLLDWEELRALPPKWLIGFSDISTLLLPFTLLTNTASIHGPNFLDFGSTPIDKSVLNILNVLSHSNKGSFKQKNFEYYQKEWLEITEESFPGYNTTEKVIWKSLHNQANVHFQGRLLGGCLDTICKLIGTPYGDVNSFIREFHKEGIIWYFESCSMDASDIYRTLWQMKMNGWFTGCNGLLYGRPDNYKDVRDFILVDALHRITEDLKIPVLYDVDLGHLPPQLLIVNGSYAEIDFSNEKGTIIQSLI